MSVVSDTGQKTLLPVDVALFREAMSLVATPVHVVTTDGPYGRAGFTCTAFASVSDAPPTVLVCLNRASSSAAAFRGNGIFAVNTLRESSLGLAHIFSGLDKRPRETRFESAHWDSGESGAPLLRDALVCFDCRLEDLHEIGSHQVMIGSVIGAVIGPAAPPLFYHARGYRSFGE